MTSVAAIEGMDRDALLGLWSELMEGAPPRSMSQPLLRRLLSWEVQAKARGGLPAATRAKLDSLRAAQAKGKTALTTSPRLKPGGRFLREWNGVTHVVDVVEGGFLWKSERHRSLSAIARAITGAHWSGPRFFGLQEAASPTAGRVGAKGVAARAKNTAKPKSSVGVISVSASSEVRSRAARLRRAA